MFFRVYPLDERGRYLPPEEVECASDAEALKIASALGGRVRAGFEIWELARFIGRFRIGPDGEPVREPDRTGGTPPTL